MSSIHRRSLRFAIVALAAPFVLAAAHAQSHAGTPLAIKAGRLLDVESGKMLQNQVILIDGERITAVGAAASTPIPAGSRMIDLSGSTVLPGLIDAHTHLTSNPRLHGYLALSVSDMRAAMYGVRAARDTLQAGFT